jgi:hypothetical protein
LHFIVGLQALARQVLTHGKDIAVSTITLELRTQPLIEYSSCN